MIESPLLKEISGYVNGRWSAAQSGKTISVTNPATGDHLADVPDMGSAETTAAVEAADAALQTEIPLAQRKRWLEQIVDLLLANKQELARIITLEQGKPLKESVVEVEYAAGFYRFCAEQIHHLEPRRLPERIRNMRWAVH